MADIKLTAFILPCLGQPFLCHTLVGLSPAIALISSGLGTLAFLLITKWQVPAYLGSSFAYIIPIKLLNEQADPVQP